MLRISDRQMKAFEQAAAKTFEDEMVAHSKEFSPRLCEVLGDDQLRVAIRRAIGRAGDYGFNLRGPVRLYIEMMFLYGSAFDSDPQYPWAAQALKSSEAQMQRAEQLYQDIVEYQEKVSGPGAANTRQALRDLAILARQPQAFAAASDDFVGAMLREMRRLFPQKATYIGEDGLCALIRQGRDIAREHGFRTRGEVMMVILMFAFGHGCNSDPLYPWISSTLEDKKIVDAPARADRLERKALTWLDHVVASFPERTQS
jgi:hypothetical protein